MVKKRNSLIEKLEEFISKYYQNLLIKGAIFFITSFTLFFIFFSFLEFVVRFDSSVRSIIFWLFLSINALVFYKSNSQATSGGGWGSRNSHAIARRT